MSLLTVSQLGLQTRDLGLEVSLCTLENVHFLHVVSLVRKYKRVVYRALDIVESLSYLMELFLY